MADSHLSHSDFFSKLAALFETRGQKSNGSVFLTQKRFSYNPSSPKPENTKGSIDTFDDLEPVSQLPLIVRATSHHGKAERADKTKLSTVVQPDDLENFYAKYAEVCKTGMSGLKKRDRKARKKDKAKKKKGGTGT